MTQPMTARQQAAQMLGVGEDATEAAVKRAYRQAVRQVHPDVQGGNPVQFEQLTYAVDLLLERRQARWSAGASQAPALTAGQTAPSAAPAAAATVFEQQTAAPSGVVVWLRSLVRLPGLLVTAVWCVLAVLAAGTGWTMLTMGAVVPAVVFLLARAVYGAVGRPEWSTITRSARRGASRVRQRRSHPVEADTDPVNLAEAATGPIPTMTEQRMREYERTGR